MLLGLCTAGSGGLMPNNPNCILGDPQPIDQVLFSQTLSDHCTALTLAALSTYTYCLPLPTPCLCCWSSMLLDNMACPGGYHVLCMLCTRLL